MGSGSWDAGKWDGYAATTSTRAATENFKARETKKDMSPLNVIREARDSVEHPNSTPIIVALDVTGSMGHIPQYMITTGLGVVFNEILTRKPVSDPQVAIWAIGDAAYDRSPLQVGQFESDMTITKWIESVHREGGGGGNRFESYELAYYFAAYKTKLDAVEKHGRKGFIFTIGDECPSTHVFAAQVKKVIGDTIQGDIPFPDLMTEVRKSYIPYHIVCMDSTAYPYHFSDSAGGKEKWAEVMGQNVLYLEDHTALAPLIVSILQLHAGEDNEAVAASWTGSTAVAVRNATKNIKLVTSGSKALVEFD